MGNRHSPRHERGRRRRSSDRDAFLSALFEAPGGRRGKPDHKTQMLCRQVQRALMLAFGGEIDGIDLSHLTVGDVRPAPDVGHLAVEVVVHRLSGESIQSLMGRLSAVTPRVRHLVAQCISRKRVPELTFVPVAGGAE